MNIQQIQDKLLAYYAQVCPTEQEVYQMLGFPQWSDYYAVYNDIWTPAFRYRLYILHNPYSTLEQAFVRGVQVGRIDGFDSGYDAALKDLNNGIAI